MSKNKIDSFIGFSFQMNHDDKMKMKSERKKIMEINNNWKEIRCYLAPDV